MLSREEMGIKESKEKAGATFDPAIDDLFARLDADKDGSISRQEWHGTEKAFKHIDADGNDSLSREEFRSPNARAWNEVFKDIDVNKDELITRGEWLDTEEAFKRLDRDHNGVITEREFYKLW
jgi:Ca2+-binding EF-hand superfamily protein